jgi:hypothetical protein
VFADIVIETNNAAGEFADENMQATLESGGSKGFGGPSVEIPEEGQVVEPNREKGVKELIKGFIDGLGLLKRPAAKNTHFARQTAERAVALSDGEDSKVFKREDKFMSDTIDREKFLETLNLEESDLDLGEEKQLEDVAVEDMMGLVADAYDIPVADLMDALDPMLDGDGEGEDMENQEGEKEDEPEEEEEEEDEMDMADMENQVESLQERVQALEDMIDDMMAAEDLEEAKEELADAETVAELRVAKDELEKRLSELEEEPDDPKTLADGDANDDVVSENISRISDGRRY